MLPSRPFFSLNLYSKYKDVGIARLLTDMVGFLKASGGVVFVGIDGTTLFSLLKNLGMMKSSSSSEEKIYKIYHISCIKITLCCCCNIWDFSSLLCSPFDPLSPFQLLLLLSNESFFKLLLVVGDLNNSRRYYWGAVHLWN